RSIGRNFAHGLADNFQTLAHFGHTHEVTCVAIGVGARGDLEIELLVAGIGEELAYIVGDAGRSQSGARDAQRDGVLRVKKAYSHGAHQPDAIARERTLVCGEARWKNVDEAPTPLQPARRRLQGQAANAEIAG